MFNSLISLELFAAIFNELIRLLVDLQGVDFKLLGSGSGHAPVFLDMNITLFSELPVSNR